MGFACSSLGVQYTLQYLQERKGQLDYAEGTNKTIKLPLEQLKSKEHPRVG